MTLRLFILTWIRIVLVGGFLSTPLYTLIGVFAGNRTYCDWWNYIPIWLVLTWLFSAVYSLPAQGILGWINHALIRRKADRRIFTLYFLGVLLLAGTVTFGIIYAFFLHERFPLVVTCAVVYTITAGFFWYRAIQGAFAAYPDKQDRTP